MPNIKLWAENADCNDLKFQHYLVGIHSISQATFEAVTHLFEPGLEPKKIDGPNHLYPRLVADCKNNILEFKYTPDNHTDNEDISYTVVAGADVYYSIAYFRGLKDIFPKAEFHFFKAITKGGAPRLANDVVFRIVEKEAGVEKVVYFGDLSDIEP